VRTVGHGSAAHRDVIGITAFTYIQRVTIKPPRSSYMRYPKAGQDDLRAPKSQFRVMAVDVTESAGAYLLGDFGTLYAATQAATKRAAVGTPVFIYNDQGKVIERLGSWH
jgi:hypothetical protein